ncbi:MAG: acyl-CoA dehydrogenase family protein [Anaerolineales bacterium]|jgi:alkylation response protein AidB-like acyl-CoA dehydrogenase|nr:acyl-CoA dehydrogenase family protein [Chloroflexota bacterium]MBK6646795.1 acyl-CoA dehydrogenase family protein [Anaerolineales bacterium]
MYSFEPNEEQQMLIDAVGKFASNDLRPAAHDAEENHAMPQKLVNKGWELGLLQASTPEAYGGFGDRSAITNVLAVEEMAFGDLAGALAVMTPSLFATPILLGGTEEQKQEYLPRIIEGAWAPYTGALIEYSFNFDPNELKTTANAEGGAYVLNGEKAFVPFAKDAEALIVYANLNGVTQGFIVKKEAAGLSISEEREKLMGLNALPMYRVKLENVTAERLGGASGHDFGLILDAMRVASAATALGVARSSLDYAKNYAKEREAFGVKIAQKQAVAFMLAEMAVELESMRLMTWEAAWKIDNNKEDSCVSAYLAFTGACDMAMMVTDRGVQIYGGHGYIRENPVELLMRNGRGFPMLLGLAIV